MNVRRATRVAYRMESAPTLRARSLVYARRATLGMALRNVIPLTIASPTMVVAMLN